MRSLGLRARSARCVHVALVALAACATPTSDDGVQQEQATPSTRDADALLGVDRERTFRDHVDRVRAIQLVSTAGLARLGTTWDAELELVRARYRDAKTNDDVRLALVALKNSFHDGHADVQLDAPAPIGPAVALPLSVRVEYEGTAPRYVVRDGGAVPGGSTVLSVDGVPMDRVERDHRAWFAGGSSPEGLREDVATWIATRSPYALKAPLPGATTTIAVRGPGGEGGSYTLTWAPRANASDACPPYADPCAKDADEDYVGAPSFVGLGYCVYPTEERDARVVRYRTFSYPNTDDPSEGACLANKLRQLSYPLSAREARAMGPHELLQRDQGELLDHLAKSSVRRVLFDLRDNTGGDFDPTFFGAFTAGSYAQPLKSFVYQPWFREDPSRIRAAHVFVGLLDGSPVEGAAAMIEAILRRAPATPASPPIPFYCQTPACAREEARLVSRSNVVFRAALLIGPRCFSACDDFVSMFRDNGIAKTIGEPTGAGDSPYAYDAELPLANGRTARMHLTVGVSFHPGTSTPLEAHPVTVDVPFPRTQANRGRYVQEAFRRAPF